MQKINLATLSVKYIILSCFFKIKSILWNIIANNYQYLDLSLKINGIKYMSKLTSYLSLIEHTAAQLNTTAM